MMAALSPLAGRPLLTEGKMGHSERDCLLKGMEMGSCSPQPCGGKLESKELGSEEAVWEGVPKADPPWARQAVYRSEAWDLGESLALSFLSEWGLGLWGPPEC